MRVLLFHFMEVSLFYCFAFSFDVSVRSLKSSFQLSKKKCF
jgi:hypothetical protein